MAATAVRAGTVEVKVTKVPNWFLLGRKGTVTINRADFVDLTVENAMQRVRKMRPWTIVSYRLNGTPLTRDGYNTVLKAGDRLELVDP